MPNITIKGRMITGKKIRTRMGHRRIKKTFINPIPSFNKKKKTQNKIINPNSISNN